MSRRRNNPATGLTRGQPGVPAVDVEATGGQGAALAALANKEIVLGITGGIAAYKAAELCRLLVKAGARVRVILTEAAGHFITPLTLQTLSGHAVARDLFDLTEESEIGHIRLADQADLIVIAPATADSIARLAAGMANDLLAAVVLAARAPVLLAPAMNVNMWENPLTQDNLGRLLGAGGGGRFFTVGPDQGPLACGWIGAGRLIEPAEIAAQAAAILSAPVVAAAGAGAVGGGSGTDGRGAEVADDLAGRRVVITAGPTHEPIDDVRFLGNRSSGKMGFALAQAAAARGAEVILVAGPVALPTPSGVARRIDITTADQMRRALADVTGTADVVVMAAAVSDFRPATRVAGKLSRRDSSEAGTVPAPALFLSLAANPDLLAELGNARRGARPLLVGFAAEVEAGDALETRARAKLIEKRCDVMVANDVSDGAGGGSVFGADDNQVTLIFADGRNVPLARASKLAIAGQIWDHLMVTLPTTPFGREPLSSPIAALTIAAVPTGRS
jgi:phosphopantothenoylcysteine decarboxylase/phosphopantothenate--cysteine ligase